MDNNAAVVIITLVSITISLAFTAFVGWLYARSSDETSKHIAMLIADGHKGTNILIDRIDGRGNK